MALGTRVMLATLGVVYLGAAPIATAAPQCGIVSWYNSKRHSHGAINGLSAAHRTLPFGTKVLVRTRKGREVIVTINDRGPFIRGRVIDVSRQAAKILGIDGIGHVCLTVVKDADSGVTASIPSKAKPAKNVPAKAATAPPPTITSTPAPTTAPAPAAAPAAPVKAPSYPTARITSYPEAQTTVATKSPHSASTPIPDTPAEKNNRGAE